MSFNPEEFNDILEAYKAGDKKELRKLIENSDPESVAAAEKYFGKSLPSFKTIGKGQGKMKKYAKLYTRRGYDAQIKKAPTPKLRRFWKRNKTFGLAERKRRATKTRKVWLEKKRIADLRIRHKTLLQSASRLKISLPYTPRKIGGRKGAYKRASTHIKNLKRENKLLKLSISRAGKSPRVGKLKGKIGVNWVWAKKNKK